MTRVNKRNEFHQYQEEAGVTIIWNSPLPLVDEDVPPAVVDAVVREVEGVKGEEDDDDVGMS